MIGTENKGDQLRRLAVRVRDEHSEPVADRSVYLLAVNALEMLDEVDAALDKARAAIKAMEVERDQARAIGKTACEDAIKVAEAQLVVIDQRDAMLPVVQAAEVRAQVLRDLREFGSGSAGWAERDRASDAGLLAAVDQAAGSSPRTWRVPTIPPDVKSVLTRAGVQWNRIGEARVWHEAGDLYHEMNESHLLASEKSLTEVKA